MSSQYSVLNPNYKGAKKYSVLVSTRIVVQADFTDYKGVKLLNRDGFLRYKDKFNKLMVQLNGEDILIAVKEAAYSVLEDNENITVIDALLAFDIYANSVEEATEKMYRTLEGMLYSTTLRYWMQIRPEWNLIVTYCYTSLIKSI